MLIDFANFVWHLRKNADIWARELCRHHCGRWDVERDLWRAEEERHDWFGFLLWLVWFPSMPCMYLFFTLDDRNLYVNIVSHMRTKNITSFDWTITNLFWNHSTHKFRYDAVALLFSLQCSLQTCTPNKWDHMIDFLSRYGLKNCTMDYASILLELKLSTNIQDKQGNKYVFLLS